MTRLLLALSLAVPLVGQMTDQQKEAFLQTAEVVRVHDIPVGTTQPLRATLQLGDFVHDAQIQQVNESALVKQLASGTQLNFRDYWAFNIAAYKLDRLLGLDMVPVAVERKYKGRNGAFAWWADDIQMMELDRWKKNIPPPDPEEWNRQMMRVRVFNQLTYNTDPNLGNVLIDKDWKIWLVDYTRAFRVQTDLRDEKALEKIDRNLLERLRALSPASVKAALGDELNSREQKSLLERRDKIIKHFEERIALEGEAAVVY